MPLECPADLGFGRPTHDIGSMVAAWKRRHKADLVDCFGATISKTACKRFQKMAKVPIPIGRDAGWRSYYSEYGWKPGLPKCLICPHHEVIDDDQRKETLKEAGRDNS